MDIYVMFYSGKKRDCASLACLGVLGDDQTSVRVGQFNVQLLGTLDDLDALAGADVVGNLGSKGAVLQQQHLQLLGVVDDNLAEAIGHQVASGSVGSVTNGGHDTLALEATADTVVNTVGLAPAGLR